MKVLYHIRSEKSRAISRSELFVILNIFATNKYIILIIISKKSKRKQKTALANIEKVLYNYGVKKK